DKRIAQHLGAHADSNEAAAALTSAALAAGTTDNSTALVLRVIRVPAANLRESINAAVALPLPPRLVIGQEIDGLRVEALLHESRLTLLYRVRLIATGESLVLKTLRPECDERESCEALAHEEWLARRVTSHYFPQVAAHRERSCLYYLMTWHEGI